MGEWVCVGQRVQRGLVGGLGSSGVELELTRAGGEALKGD